MSIILIVAVFVILAFVIGAALLFRGFTSLPDTSASLQDLEKTQNDLKTANLETEKLRGQSNTLAVQLEEMKAKVAWAEGNVKALEEALRKTGQAQSKIDQLEKDLQFLIQKADGQAREAIDVITSLAAQTETVKAQSTQAAETPAASAEELEKLRDENQKLQIQVDGYSSKVKDLEAAVAAASDSSAKAKDAGATNTQFVEENALLKKNLAELEEKIKAEKTQAEQFKAQYEKALADLQAKVAQEANKSAPSGVDPAVLEVEIKRVRIQAEEKIVQANAALVKLNTEIEALTAQITEKDEKLKKMTEELYSTRQELAESLRAANELKKSDPLPAPAEFDGDLQKRLKEVLAANQILKDKERILLSKLALSRAQALSLERLCDELKEHSALK